MHTALLLDMVADAVSDRLAFGKRAEGLTFAEGVGQHPDFGRAVVGQRVVEGRRFRDFVREVEELQQERAGLVGFRDRAEELDVLLREEDAPAVEVALIAGQDRKLVGFEEAADGRIGLVFLLADLDREREGLAVLPHEGEIGVGDARALPIERQHVDGFKIAQRIAARLPVFARGLRTGPIEVADVLDRDRVAVTLVS